MHIWERGRAKRAGLVALTGVMLAGKVADWHLPGDDHEPEPVAFGGTLNVTLLTSGPAVSGTAGTGYVDAGGPINHATAWVDEGFDLLVHARLTAPPAAIHPAPRPYFEWRWRPPTSAEFAAWLRQVQGAD